MAVKLLGKEVNKVFNAKIIERVNKLKEQGVVPTLGIVRVGENPSDLSYEKSAVKRCELLGVEQKKFLFEEQVTTEELLKKIEELNFDEKIHGVLLFRPLPKHLDQRRIEEALSPEKDIDCMTQMAMYGVMSGKKIGFPPCTAQACIEMLRHYEIECEGKHVVVIGRSMVIGKPVAMMLLDQNATITICHSKTKDLKKIVREADIVVVAAGKAGILDETFVCEGQVILDVGINVDQNGKLCGDVNFPVVEPIVDAITPVPGGLGAVTTSVLIEHVVSAAEKLS